MFGVILLVSVPLAAAAGLWLNIGRLLPPDTPDAYDDRGNVNGTHRPGRKS